MRFLSFFLGRSQEIRWGLCHEGKVFDAAEAAPDFPKTLLGFIEQHELLMPRLRAFLERVNGNGGLDPGHLRWMAPLPNPPSLKDFFAFEEHALAGARRRGEPLPEEWYQIPAYYKGNHRQIFGPEDEIPWPAYTKKLDFECEVACVAGKKGINLSPEEAKRHIFGYMIFNDFSARDIQQREMRLRFGPNKAKDFANAFGPLLVTADELDPSKGLAVTLRVNGEVWSRGNLQDQHWGFPALISHCSQSEWIYPGDILGSGTFYKGCGLDLDRWIKPGDLIEIEAQPLGILRNRIGHPAQFHELNYHTEPAVKVI
ncbi:MAG: fumarylacetoacetate hydrolase family protein [Elusimicrobia bacterium]|nr:fumarylacetoacetate hydrolase family protein [Elusimicrobiota bacterium]